MHYQLYYIAMKRIVRDVDITTASLSCKREGFNLWDKMVLVEGIEPSTSVV